MAPVLSRSLTAVSLASFPSSSHFTARNSRRASTLTNVFLPRNANLRNGFSSFGCKLHKRSNKFAIRCDAAVAEKEVTDAPSEKFEYQAEVGKKSIFFLLLFLIFLHFISLSESLIFYANPSFLPNIG